MCPHVVTATQATHYLPVGQQDVPAYVTMASGAQGAEDLPSCKGLDPLVTQAWYSRTPHKKSGLALVRLCMGCVGLFFVVMLCR